ncbi:hypothetical protein IWX90DRAFT_487938 [Phyllosticta citrichinensis]|uniref:Heat shock protein 70 n=1 Tax=Phyllosticta citrichinensis TaxID=1130410 RepID=A0ABR1XMH3_9PEZI
MATQHRIVLGLDFGTTCTGIAYSTTDNTANDIEIISTWPKGTGSCKIPTKIAYKDDNPDLPQQNGAQREAALAAGFGSRPGDTIRLISEPEAAALTVIHSSNCQRMVNPITIGETFMVCDCGEGTVDVITYTVKSLRPPRFEEACRGDGGQFGALMINRNFENWMEEKFEKQYTAIATGQRGSYSRMMASFEAAKQDFGSEDEDEDREVYVVFHVDMDHDSTEIYNREDHTVRIAKTEMKRFFETAARKVLELIEKQIGQAKRRNHEVSRIILVGGFGESEYLNAAINNFCKP